ncbi:MAG TPA: SGNH/GDSL hydrolase family protein [Rubrobacter sp.]|nr:SGNH/GDSL hydrolase family protein [Rubrobacter sp.]
MKTVLCYGDSNTWGSDPETGERFPEDVRWPGVLARNLGEGYRVIEEGLPGRTTVWNDPIEGDYKNGRTYLMACLESHRPIDLITLMLGTNDLKARFGTSASDIAQAATSLAEIMLRCGCGPDGGAPVVVLICPPAVAKLTDMAQMFEGAEAKSMRFPEHYERFAEKIGSEFLDASQVIVSSDVDGIHLDAGEHRKLGEAVAERIRRIFQ